MRILIAGGGRTGATLALTLHAQRHEVRLMEHRPGVLVGGALHLAAEVVGVHHLPLKLGGMVASRCHLHEGVDHAHVV